MTTEIQSHEPVKMYRPWVGVLLSFFIAGAGQFLAGKRLNGFCWLLLLFLLEITCVWCFVSPMVPSDIPGLVLFVVFFIFWVVMLVKSYRPVPRFRWFGWILFIVLFLVSKEEINEGFDSCLRAFKVPTNSMAPTICGGTMQPDKRTFVGSDRILVEEYAYWHRKPQRGDITIFRTTGILQEQRDSYEILPNEYEVKRIAGVPGDVLSIREGHLYNHGQIVSEPAGLAKLDFPNLKMAQSNFFENLFNSFYLTNSTIGYEVPNGTYFVIGDNTTNSLDSRYFGPIKAESIIGKVSKIFWPWNRVGKVQ